MKLFSQNSMFFVKRLFLFTFAMIVGLSESYATGFETINGFRYLLDTDSKTAILVANNDNEYVGDIIVPEKIIGKDGVECVVVALGDNCFKESSVQSVFLPSTIKAIGEGCFAGCAKLLRVNIPSSITEVRNDCFKKCINLTNVDIPNSIVSLGESCFEGCLKLSSITVPSSVLQIGESCFADCIGLKNLNLQAPINVLRFRCFYNCSSLKDIVIPTTVLKIGQGCFYGCSELENIQIPSSVFYLGNSCFMNCVNLQKIDIPATVEELLDGTFEGCSKLRVVNLPISLKTISYWCFKNCSSLKKLEIPSSVSFLGTDGFTGCSNLEELNFGGDVPRNIEMSNIPTTCMIFVPKDKLQSYKEILGVRYAFVYPFEKQTGINHVKTSSEITPVACYSINGSKLETPVKGLNIVRYSDGSIRKEIQK